MIRKWSGLTLDESELKTHTIKPTKVTWGGEHTIKYTDNVLQNCTHETYIILLTNIISTNSM